MENEGGVAADLKRRLALAVRSIQWSYGIFWSISTTRQPGCCLSSLHERLCAAFSQPAAHFYLISFCRPTAIQVNSFHFEDFEVPRAAFPSDSQFIYLSSSLFHPHHLIPLISTYQVFEWGDGYYNGDIKTRKTIQSVDFNLDELGLWRSEQLRELYESLSTGGSSPQAERRIELASPVDVDLRCSFCGQQKS